MNAQTLRKIALDNLPSRYNEDTFKEKILPLLLEQARGGRFELTLAGEDYDTVYRLKDYISSLGYDVRIGLKKAIINW